ncbi:hypothetical protein VPHD482_0356 [Vibrio phage D482]
MKKETNNVTCKITDVGNFNVLVKSWYVEGDFVRGVTLEVGDVVNIKEYNDPLVSGGVYSAIKVSKDGNVYSTTVLGRLVFDRTDSSYVMKNDKHRIQYSTTL